MMMNKKVKPITKPKDLQSLGKKTADKLKDVKC